MINQATFGGRLVADPDLRTFQSGTTLARFRIANNSRYKDRDGEMQESVTYMTCELWGQSARKFAERARKGSVVVVFGMLEANDYEDRNGVQKREIKLSARRFVIGETERRNRETDYDGPPSD